MWPRPPLASPPASLFFSLYTVPSQKASGKSHSEASPGHIYKNLPRLRYPGTPSNFFPFTMPPLRRPRATLCICLPPCFTFFLPLHGQVSQRSKPRPHIQKLAPERLLRPPPSLPPASNSFSLYSPLSGGLGQVFLYVAGARFARPNHIYKNLPCLYYPLLTHPRTPHFPSPSSTLSKAPLQTPLEARL